MADILSEGQLQNLEQLITKYGTTFEQRSAVEFWEVKRLLATIRGLQHGKHMILCPARNNDHGQMAAVIIVPADADPKEIFRRAVNDNRGNPSIEKFLLVQVVDEVRN